MSSFFDPPPPPPEPPERPRPRPHRPWHGVPAGVVGRTVALDLVLGRSATAAVWIPSVTVYPEVFEFQLEIRHRDREALSHQFMWPHGPSRRAGELDPELLRFGLQFSDGSKATNLYPGPAPRDPDRPPAGPILAGGGGGGGGDAAGGSRWQYEYWVWPLPPEGPLVFVCEWPIGDIPETRSEMDSAPLRDAARDAVALWSGSEPEGDSGDWSYETHIVELPQAPSESPKPADPAA